jgi:chromate transporter
MQLFNIKYCEISERVLYLARHKKWAKVKKTYLKLFTTTFFISAFTFGGGYVIVPLMKKKFVEDLKWIDEKEMLDLIAIAQSSPGAIAVNTSILLGYQKAGILGAAMTVLGTVMPPFIILSIISLFYNSFRGNEVIGALLNGMQAGVAAVIADVVLSMGTDVVREKKMLSVIIMTASFVAAFFFKVNVVYIILICGVIGAASALHNKQSRRDTNK